MNKRSLTILLVDSDEAEYLSVRRELYSTYRNDRYDFGLEWRDSLAHGLQAVSQNLYDAILLELNLSDAGGEEPFHKISALVPDIPIIIHTAADSETLASRLVQAGAQDYIVKGKYTGLLARSVLLAIERQETIRRLQKSERQTRAAALAKSAFFSNMNHEIRNPLTSIIGYSDVLLGTSLTRAESEKALAAISTNGKHLLKLISDILDLSKIDAGELKTDSNVENLAPFLRDIRQTFLQAARQKGIEFGIELSAPIPSRFRTDFFRLRQVLYNIVGNAIKFTKEGYVKVFVSVNEDDRTISFDVRDSGVGISEQAKSSLFKSFSQGEAGRAREFGGTGLGLVISHELITKLGGHMDFRSRQGVGSVFTVTLPLDEAGLSSLSRELPSLDEYIEPISCNGDLSVRGTVLVADDVQDNLDLMSLLLSRVGLEVHTAADGLATVHLASNIAFDLILLDMQMPGMSGQEVAKTLRGNGCSTPIVATTAMSLEESLEECLSVGCDACLPKPFSQQELYSCILKFLGKKESRESDTAVKDPSVKNDELAKVRRNFIRRLSSRIEDMEAALAAKDLDKLRTEAHRLIGAGLFGFQDLSHFGGTLESLIIQEQTGGLSLVEALVNKVKKEVGKISLSGSEPKAGSEGEQTYGRVATVIVLDDDEANLKSICRVLSVKGFIAAPARTGEEALALCKDASISLLIIALETTGNENFSIIPQIRERLKRNIPVVAMTSRLPSEVRTKLTEIDVSELLVKPISRDHLLGTIDSLITAAITSGVAAPIVNEANEAAGVQ